MTLERRLSEALHEVDSFQPSPDLFARVERSIEEDDAHRRRARIAWFASVASITAIVVYLGLLVTRDATGRLVVPKWSLELLQAVLLVAILLLLGPLIRRFGGHYASDVFRLDPETGLRFLRLLDTAYYLVFAGAILRGVSTTGLGRRIVLQEGLDDSLSRVAVVIGMLGVFHALNLMIMPFLGLVFSSTVRRAERARAGALAPPLSEAAAHIDRIVTRSVWGLAIAIGLGTVLVLGLVMGLALDGLGS